MKFNLENTFIEEMPADPILLNTRRQVEKACYSFVTPRVPTSPCLIHVSPEMANELGLSLADTRSESFLYVFSGSSLIPETKPYAMCYGGHQFGHWAGQLGDGRAINLAQIRSKGKNWTLQLKGAGETPYSRSADGLAVLRSSIREHLCSEAMHHLGVPTTRSLSLILTGDQVLRDVMYDGNPAYEKGAVVCRVAPSFLRFGNYQLFASRGDFDSLKKLVDHTIKHYFDEISLASANAYLAFFEEVCNRTLKMIIHWQRVGFVHGVMNTDNMSILGLTIDYGPYGWLEDFDPGWTPNTTDRQKRRYRFGQQANVSLWNLYQLANALFPLINQKEALEEILDSYAQNFSAQYYQMMSKKLGLSDKHEVRKLIVELQEVLQKSETDMTIWFRLLANFEASSQIDEQGAYLKFIEQAFYKPEEIQGEVLQQWNKWFTSYKKQLVLESIPQGERKRLMDLSNPKYVCLLYTSPSPRDATLSRMPSSA